MSLESMVTNAKEAPLRGIVYAVCKYNSAYKKHPKITNYISQTVGTVGGDFIAKTSQGKEYTFRDLVFTLGASTYQSFVYPKVVDFTNKALKNKKIKKIYKKIGVNEKWAKAITMTAAFFPLNMFYWNILSIKNKSPINWEAQKEGVKTIMEASIPYLGVDYLVANKLNKKYALPTWSVAELGYNIYLALRNIFFRN